MNRKLLATILIITAITIIGCSNKQITQPASNDTTQRSTNTQAQQSTTTNNNTATVKDTNSSEQENQVPYKQYTNDRYDYSIEYPSDFSAGTAPDNNDGLGFQSSDGKTKLTVWGNNNVFNKTAISEYNDLLSQHSNASYKKLIGNWFVVSWTEADNIVYQKTVVGSGSENTFTITYPVSQKDYYNAIVAHLNATFKNPGIDTVH